MGYTHLPRMPDAIDSNPKITRNTASKNTSVPNPRPGNIITAKPMIIPSIPTMIPPAVPRAALAIPANNSDKPSR